MNPDYRFTYEYYNTYNYCNKIMPQIMESPRTIGKTKVVLFRLIYKDMLEIQKVKVKSSFRYMILDNPHNANMIFSTLFRHRNELLKAIAEKKTSVFIEEAKRIVDKRYKIRENLENDVDYKTGYLNIRPFIPTGKWIDEGIDDNGTKKYLSIFYVLTVVKAISSYITEEYLPRLQEKSVFIYGRNKDKKRPIKIWHKAL